MGVDSFYTSALTLQLEIAQAIKNALKFSMISCLECF